jgi:hypothetical protein
MPDIFTTAAID